MGKKNVSDIVAGAGFLTSIFDKLVKAVERRDGTAAQLHRLATEAGDDIIGRIADIIVGMPERAAYPLTIDCTQPLGAIINDGQYDSVNPDITEENFPVVPGKARVVTELLDQDRIVSYAETLVEMGRQGVRPATLRELLEFGKQYPNIQRECPIVAIGSYWTDLDGRRRVGCLWGNPDKRGLDLGYLGGDWDPGFRLLAVHLDA